MEISRADGRANADTQFGPIRMVNINGVSIAYLEEGEGEPVVFVHGDLADLRTWAPQLPAIGATHRAITYSRRYARPNADIPPGAQNPIATHIEDLVSLLRALGAAPAHLVGSSWGAFICLLTAARHPDVVRTMILEEPPVLPLFVRVPPSPAELLRLLLRRPGTALAVMKFGNTTLRPAEKAFRRGDDDRAVQTFARGVLGEGRWDGLPEDVKRQARDNASTLKASLLHGGFPPLNDEVLRTVKTPTLLLNAEDGPPLFARLLDRLEELLPNTEREEIPDAGHDMHEDNPTAVNEAIRRFLSRHGGMGAAGRSIH